MKEKDDEILWILCLEGAIDAFEQLYRRFYKRLYVYGCKCTTDKELVRNVIQDLFVKIISGYKKLSPTKHVNEYLFKAFRRRLFDALKENRMIFLDDLSILTNIDFPDEEQSVEQEQLRKLKQAYKELTFNQRRIIYLYYICKLSHDEIADILNINYQSSKNLLHRSLVQLRSEFFRRSLK